MKLDINLLSMRFSQSKETPAVPTDSVNPYLLEKILRPHMDGQDVYIGESTSMPLTQKTLGRWQSISTG